MENMEKRVKDILDEVDINYFQKKLGHVFDEWKEFPLSQETAEKSGIGVEAYETKMD